MAEPTLFDIAHIRPVGGPGSGLYYDETPGHAVKMNGQQVAVGAVVEIRPKGYPRNPVWIGRVTAHMHVAADDAYMGLSVAECVDPKDFGRWGYRFAGQVVQIEAGEVHPVAAPARGGEER